MGSNKKKRNAAFDSSTSTLPDPKAVNMTPPSRVISTTSSKLDDFTVVTPELEKKYIFKGDRSILLKDGSKIGGNQVGGGG